jgi:hypothetical protein
VQVHVLKVADVVAAAVERQDDRQTAAGGRRCRRIDEPLAHVAADRET